MMAVVDLIQIAVVGALVAGSAVVAAKNVAAQLKPPPAEPAPVPIKQLTRPRK